MKSEYQDAISGHTTEITGSMADLKHRLTREEAYLNKRFMEPGKSGYNFSRMGSEDGGPNNVQN